jgi:hypothetical protein
MSRERVIRTYRDNEWQREADGTLILTRRHLDLVTSRHKATEVTLRPDGSRFERRHTFRFYTLTELIKMLRAAGLAYRQAWGDFDASPYTLASRRMIVLAEEAGEAHFSARPSLRQTQGRLAQGERV